MSHEATTYPVEMPASYAEGVPLHIVEVTGEASPENLERLLRQREVLTKICGNEYDVEINNLRDEHVSDFMEKILIAYGEHMDNPARLSKQIAPLRAYIDGKTNYEINKLYDHPQRSVKTARNSLLTHIRTTIMMPRRTMKTVMPVVSNEEKLLQEIEVADTIVSPACRDEDPELFFPNKGEANKAEAAKRVCLSCSARTACLDWALEKNMPFGVWGGLTEQERRAINRRKKVIIY